MKKVDKFMLFLPEIENENFTHIIGITNTGARNESKVGLTHLTEHTCLLPAFLKSKNINDGSIKICGVTCPHYMFLYVATPLEYQIWANEWIHSVISGEVVTDKNVSIAKRQIFFECRALQETTEMRRQVVDFVSEGQIQRLPIGTAENINEILTQEVSTRLLHFFENNSFRVFSFQTAKELWDQYKKNPIFVNDDILAKKSKYSFIRDQIISLTNRSIEKCTIEYFFPLPEIRTSEEYLTIIFLETLLAYIIEETLPFSTKVSEKFFSRELGFLSVQLSPPSGFHFEEYYALEWIDYIRKNIFTHITDALSFSDIKKRISEDISQIRSDNIFYSTSECWAQIMSNVVYGRPMYDFEHRKSIYDFLQKTDISILEVLREYIFSPTKVIIYLPCL